MMRALALLICLLNITVARAAVTCDVLLAAAISSETNQSSVAKSYVNLIQLYLKQDGAKSREVVIGEILNSKEFINPFAGGKDTLSIQFTAALNKIQPQISNPDWQNIQKLLARAEKKNEIEKQDRAEKEDQTSFILKDKILPQDVDIGYAVARPAWQVVNNRLLMFVANFHGGISLLEYKNGKTQILDSHQVGTTIRQNPHWQEINGEYFIAVTVTSKKSAGSEVLQENLQLFKLVGDKLERKNQQVLKGLSEPSWQMIDGQAFIAIGSGTGELLIYKLVDEELVLVSSFWESEKSFRFGVESKPSWHIVGDRIFLAVITNRSLLMLFEFVDDQLKYLGGQNDTFSDKLAIHSDAKWQTVDGRTYLAVGADNDKLYLYELLDNKLEKIASYKVGKIEQASPAWYTVDGRTFLLMGSDDVANKLRLFELVNGKLKRLGCQKFIGAIHKEAAGFMLDNQFFVAVSDTNSKVSIYELVGSSLELRKSIQLAIRIHGSPAWQNVGDRILLANAVSGKGLLLIQAFEKTKKQGGRK